MRSWWSFVHFSGPELQNPKDSAIWLFSSHVLYAHQGCCFCFVCLFLLFSEHCSATGLQKVQNFYMLYFCRSAEGLQKKKFVSQCDLSVRRFFLLEKALLAHVYWRKGPGLLRLSSPKNSMPPKPFQTLWYERFYISAWSVGESCGICYYRYIMLFVGSVGVAKSLHVR